MCTIFRSPRNTAFVACAIALFLCTFAPGIPPAGAETPDDAYQKEIAQWYQSRVERLTREDGYLTLAGLFPLVDGENSFGSAEENDMVFPDKAPATAGVFVLEDGVVTIEVPENVTITTGGRPVRSMRLETDMQDETTVLEMGTYRFYVIDRGGRLYIRLKDLDSKLLKEFEGIDRFPVDIAWRVVGRFEPYDPPKLLRIPNVLGYETEEPCPGAVAFEIGGKTYRLEPIPSGDRLFFIFGDETSGVETYAGGRFLTADAPSEDGSVVLDFNKAYNPPCVFTPYATCPLPHPANRLPIRIEAGEKMYGKSH